MVNSNDIATTIANFEPDTIEGKSDAKKAGHRAVDLSHHLSKESSTRRPSPLKEASLHRKYSIIKFHIY